MIIPTFNERSTIVECINQTSRVLPMSEIIICDGESTDDTVTLAQRNAAIVTKCERGRGQQLSHGVSKSSGDIVILLHSDSRLPENTQSILNVFFSYPENKICMFRMNFNEDSSLLKFYSFFTRFESIFTSFGDQTIVVRKNFYDQLNGFKEMCIMEDVDFLSRARKLNKIIKHNSYVTTSSRRFKKNGVINQQLRNCVYVLMYLSGFSPETIKRRYERSRS